MPYFESGSVSAASYNGQKASTSKESVMQNINLYRGAATSNVTLVNLNGLDELDVGITANYSPEDETFFDNNRTCRNSILGTGFTMPLASIFTKSRAAKETFQSDFFITGTGGEFPLYRTGKKGSYVEFLSVEYPFHIFKKYENKWEIIKDDGSIWTYGDSTDSLEINVSWGNWTGACNSPNGKEFPVAWYLSKVTSRYGNSITFTYENIKRPLGGCKYTSEIRLKTIRSTFGETAVLNYKPKEKNEYTLEHNADTGVHQFLCERNYLDSLDIFSPEGALLHSQKLFYELVPAAKTEVKRLLVCVKQVMKNGEILPGLQLKWNLSGDLAGHLSKITYPRDGGVEFTYSKQEVAGHKSDTFLECAADWNKSIVNGTDFTAALFTRNNAARLKILGWDVSWQVFEDEQINKRGVQNATLFTGNGIVAVRYLANDRNYTLRIMKRNPVKRYDWEGFDLNLQSAVCPSVACGNDFVAVQYPNKNGIKIYQFNYTDNKWHEFELPVDAMGRQIIGAGNGCVFGAYGNDNSQNIRLVTFYSDENHQWRVGDAVSISAPVTWNYANSLPVWSINGSIASACFVADKGSSIEATMVAVSWNENFKIIKNEIQKVSQLKTAGNPIFFSVTTDTMIGFANTALRYTPSGFVRNILFNPSADCEYAYSYSGDLFLGAEKQANGTQRFKAIRFDAARGAWTEEGVPFSNALSSSKEICRPLATANYAVLGRSVFVRDTNEKWKDIGGIPDGVDLTTIRLDPGGRYLLYAVPQANLVRFVPLSPTGFGRSIDISGGKISGESYYEAGSASFFLASGQMSGFNFYNLHRQLYCKEAPKMTLLSNVILDSGLEKQTVFLEYDMKSARIENGLFAAGTVSVLPAARNGSFGKTVYSYFNGSSPARFKYPVTDKYCNAADFYTHFAGQVYTTVSYDGEGKKTAENHSFMKAFDTRGFCIRQTKVTDSDFVRRFNLDNKAIQVTDEIKSEIEYEYEPKYYRRRKMLKKSFDKKGKEVIISQVIRYAFEDYPEMQPANVINDISLLTGKNETKNIITSSYKYEYGKNSAGYYYQKAEYKKGRADGEWLKVNSVIDVDTHCKALCTSDERGHPTSVLYDKAGLYPIATTTYSCPDETLYCGFEPYETTGRLTIDGKIIESYITEDECFSGARALKLQKGKKLVVQIKLRDGGLRLRFSAKSSGKIYASADFGNGDIIEKSFGKQDNWVSNTALFSAKKAGTSAVITFQSPEADSYIDALYVTPINAKGEAYVYTGGRKLQTASHSSYGAGIRTYFDRYETPCLYVSDEGNFISFSNTIYNLGGIVNEMYTIKPSAEGVVCDLRQGYSKNPLFTPSQGGWDFSWSDNFALMFSSGKNIPSISFGNASLTCSDGVWTLNNGAEKQTAAAPCGTVYVLIKMGKRCRFYGDGVILFTFTNDSKNASLKLTNSSDLQYIGYVPNPDIVLSCADYSGRVIQDQIVTGDSLRIVHTLYNKLGVQAARTNQVEINDAFWGYRKNFVTAYNDNTGETTGEINSLFPEAGAYPCTSFKTTHSSEPELKELAQPGSEFKFGSGLTVKHQSCSLGGFSEFVSDGYCQGNTITDPDGMVTVNINGNNEQKVMSARVSADGAVSEITAYEYDVYDNMTKIYYPNHFSEINNAEEFISVIEYDSLNNIKSRKDPNTDKVLTVYDRFGNLRFMKQNESSGLYIYHLYDEFGRAAEIGQITKVWNDAALRGEADQPNIRPQGGNPVRQMFYDDIGQLIKLTTTVNGKTVDEGYEYDKYGRQIKYILRANGKTEESITEYNTAGNVTARRTGNPLDGSLGYSYDVNGALSGVSYNGKEIYRCGYTSGGGLAYEMLGNNRRGYSYNTANYLTGIKGPFFEQKLTYFEEGSKKSGQISKVQTHFGLDNHAINCDGNSFKKDSSFMAKYDALGRITSVLADNSNPLKYNYDANGNQQREGIKYHPGTDKLTLLDGNNVSYETFGAVKSVAGKYDFRYDAVTQLAYGVNNIEYIIGNGICGFDSGKGLTLEVQSEDGKLFFERNPDGDAVILVHGANGVFAQILKGKVYYLIKDYRSSVCGIADANTLLAAYNYDLFGNIIDKFEHENIPTALIPLKFAGARYESTGLYRFKMRFYDPLTGRFLSIDPEAQYPNPYIYGTCDWINYFDPDGAFNIGGFIASLVVGLALVAVGAAVTIMTAGMGGALGVTLGLVGAGLIGAGIASTIYCITSAINDDFSWAAWGIHMGSGFVTGVVFAGIGAAMPTTIGVAGSLAIDMTCGVLIGATDGIVTNGLLNISNGQDFFENVITNAVTGAVVGGIFGAVTGISTGVRNARSMVRKSGPNGRQMGYQNSPGGSGGGHSRIGVRPGNAGDSTAGSHLVIAGGKKANVLGSEIRSCDLNPNRAKWLNVTDDVYNRAHGAMAGPDGQLIRQNGTYNKVFNNCTGYVVRASADAGICQPLWVRSPNTLKLWAFLAGALQS
ncbi:MAG: hypothetical protein FWE14_04450 [Lachnospiraceae bacterium]|nr:hypothetical protein [Lachnospiraceae bacterium]